MLQSKEKRDRSTSIPYVKFVFTTLMTTITTYVLFVFTNLMTTIITYVLCLFLNRKDLGGTNRQVLLLGAQHLFRREQ